MSRTVCADGVTKFLKDLLHQNALGILSAPGDLPRTQYLIFVERVIAGWVPVVRLSYERMVTGGYRFISAYDIDVGRDIDFPPACMSRTVGQAILQPLGVSESEFDLFKACGCPVLLCPDGGRITQPMA